MDTKDNKTAKIYIYGYWYTILTNSWNKINIKPQFVSNWLRNYQLDSSRFSPSVSAVAFGDKLPLLEFYIHSAKHSYFAYKPMGRMFLMIILCSFCHNFTRNFYWRDSFRSVFVVKKYKLLTKRMHWNTAQRSCKKLYRGSLVVIRNEKEQKDVETYLKGTKIQR